MRFRLFAILSVLLLSGTIANAQPGLAPPGQTPIRYQPSAEPFPSHLTLAPPAQTRTVRYGWQLFVADLATWTLISAGAENSDGLAALGTAGFFFSAPIVHLANGNNSGALFSLLARTGLPFGGAVLGAASCGGNDGYGCIGNVFVGALLGYGTALSLDYFVIAKKTETIAPQSGWASLRPSLSISPTEAKAGIAFVF